MKKLPIILIAIITVLISCNDYETYGDLKEKERNAISKFIADSSITVISEDQFNQAGQTTDLARNEFVKLDKSGVYLQIVRKGCGTQLQDGETVNLVCRYTEFNILTDSIVTRNNTTVYGDMPDVMRVTRTSGTFTAQFTKGNMLYAYQSASVPPGWLVPLSYIHVGRPEKDDDEISKVRIIVPHSQGHTSATSNVTPYFYVITFQREA